MALSNTDVVALLRNRSLVVDPFTPAHLQTAGIQLSLGNRLAKMKPGQRIDPAKKIPPEWNVFEIDPVEGYDVQPGEFLLGHTLEKLTIPRNILAMVDGRSTPARIGIVPHLAAMAIWPGHGGGQGGPRSITLELKNEGDATIVFRPGWWIANLTLHRLETPVEISYDAAKKSKYGTDTGIMLPTFNGELMDPSQFVTDFEAFSVG